MKKITVFFLFIALFGNAQIHRFIYEYKFVPDSTKRDEVKKEMMALDINSKGSTYQSMQKIVADSTMKAQINKMMASGGGNLSFNKRMNSGDIDYKVTKEYPDFKVFLHQRVSVDAYKIAENEKPVWKILPDKQKIGEYNAQKATTDFGGRHWIAWFSEDLPFQDGPYKFFGLPGLIVKIEDKTNSHIMTLVANKKIAEAEEQEVKPQGNMRIIGMGGKEIEVSEDQFKKLWKNYVNDPAKNMREMMNQSNPNMKVVFKVKTDDGKEITDPNEMSRNLEKRVKEQEKANNNKIEPSLYK